MIFCVSFFCFLFFVHSAGVLSDEVNFSYFFRKLIVPSYFCLSTLVLVVALEKVERSSGSLIGNNIASIQKSAAPEVIFETL